MYEVADGLFGVGSDVVEPLHRLLCVDADALVRLSQDTESLKCWKLLVGGLKYIHSHALCKDTNTRIEPWLTHFRIPSRVLFLRPAIRAVSSTMQLKSLRGAMDWVVGCGLSLFICVILC